VIIKRETVYVICIDHMAEGTKAMGYKHQDRRFEPGWRQKLFFYFFYFGIARSAYRALLRIWINFGYLRDPRRDFTCIRRTCTVESVLCKTGFFRLCSVYVRVLHKCSP